MNKVLTVLAVLGLLATGAASAQNVNISGSIEMAIKTTAAGVTSLGASKTDRNNLTFSGVEKLDGDLSVDWMLQNRFTTDTGTSAQTNSSTSSYPELFEQTRLGLNSNRFGQLRLGRFTSTMASNESRFLFQEDSTFGANHTTQYTRLSSQREYTTPDIMGFKYTWLRADASANKYITFATGNGTTTTTDMSSGAVDLTSHTISYDKGPFFASATAMSGLQGETSKRYGGMVDMSYFGVNNLKLGAGRFRQIQTLGTQTPHNNTYLGAEYKIGPWTAAVTTSVADAATSSTTGRVGKNGAKLYYALSKRTTLQAEWLDTRNATAATNGASYYVGMRHTF